MRGPVEEFPEIPGGNSPREDCPIARVAGILGASWKKSGCWPEAGNEAVDSVRLRACLASH